MNTTVWVLIMMILFVPVPFLWKYGVSSKQIRVALTGILSAAVLIAVFYLIKAAG